MKRQVQTAVLAGLRSRFGIWPLYELRNKVLHWPDGLRAADIERREVRRLGGGAEVPSALVATIVPTCRRPESVVRAVRSALDQTVRDHVVVVVDDGAGLPALPDDERLFAFSLSRNLARPGVVRNVGIALSRSTFLAFLDDDNEWRPDHLAVALEKLQRGADAVYTAVERRHPDGTRLDVLSRAFDRGALREWAFVDTNAIVVRRGPGVHFSRLPRSHDKVPGEDWELIWRLSRTHRVMHVPETTVSYLVNPNSYFTRWAPMPTAPLTTPDTRR